MVSRNVLCYGSVQMYPQKYLLRAGPLTLVYTDGELRTIKLGEREILRRVYIAVRDRNWETIPIALSEVRIDTSADRFQISFLADHSRADIHFDWRGEIRGDSDGTVTFTMDGTAQSSFLRNRIGFCVLHPIAECAGQPCVVKHTDGDVERGVFPEMIAPHQPFLDIRNLSHQIALDLEADITFDGDVFEMEDQRNWTDASYKTYCTPLALPFPAWIKAGTAVRQSITLRLRGKLPAAISDTANGPVQVMLPDGAPCSLPRLGLCSSDRSLTAREAGLLRKLNLNHLRADLELSLPDYTARLNRAAQQAEVLEVGLIAALHLSDDHEREIARFCDLVESNGMAIAGWMLFPQTRETSAGKQFASVRRTLARRFPGKPIYGGTDAYFAELNRERPGLVGADGVVWSINPQVHAFDNDSLMQTLESLPLQVASARALYSNQPLWIGPITLKPRSNPNATGASVMAEPGALPPEFDVRQMSLFAAAWTIASLKRLADSGVAALTYFEPVGTGGLMESKTGSSWPDQFHTLPRDVFPLYHALAWLGPFAECEVLPAISDRPDAVECLAVRNHSQIRLLLANLTGCVQAVKFNLSGPAQMRILDETNAEEAMRMPESVHGSDGAPRAIDKVSLRPYAVAQITMQRAYATSTTR